METLSGVVKKMHTNGESQVEYQWVSGESKMPLNPLLGKKLKLEFAGKISCIHCQRPIKKSFNQGYCFPCSQKLAACDMCILKPELCHYFNGTCREPEWGEKHCMIPHTVYLANSSGPKVGITRSHQQKTRWVDQGASQAIVLGVVPNRKISGEIETSLKSQVADKTNWRKMLQNAQPELDLRQLKQELLKHWPSELAGSIANSEDGNNIFEFNYPVLEYPTKISSFNLDKKPIAEGSLMGIKGQYLIFDTGVINIRKYTGYEITLEF